MFMSTVTAGILKRAALKEPEHKAQDEMVESPLKRLDMRVTHTYTCTVHTKLCELLCVCVIPVCIALRSLWFYHMMNNI